MKLYVITTCLLGLGYGQAEASSSWQQCGTVTYNSTTDQQTRRNTTYQSSKGTYTMPVSYTAKVYYHSHHGRYDIRLHVTDLQYHWSPQPLNCGTQCNGQYAQCINRGAPVCYNNGTYYPGTLQGSNITCKTNTMICHTGVTMTKEEQKKRERLLGGVSGKVLTLNDFYVQSRTSNHKGWCSDINNAYLEPSIGNPKPGDTFYFTITANGKTGRSGNITIPR